MPNQYDSAFKSSASRDPRAMLFLAGRLALEGPERIDPFEREIVTPQRIADQVFKVTSGGKQWFEHLEALTRWADREPEAILNRVGLLIMLPELRKQRIELTVVLLTPEDLPREPLPLEFACEWGKAKLSVEVRYVRLWELQGHDLVDTTHPVLLPWLTLTAVDDGDMRRLGARVAASDDEELGAQFVTLGSLRYHEDYLRDLLGRFGRMFTTELAAQTPFGKKILDQGIEKGREEGLSAGREEGVGIGRRAAEIDLLETVLSDRFPALAARHGHGAFDRLQSPATLMRALVLAPSEEAAAALIDDATRAR